MAPDPNLPWWAWAYIAIAAVGVLGYRQVDLSAKILIVLVILEYLVVFVIDAAILVKGGDAGLSVTPFTWEAFTSGSPTIGIHFCFAAFICFEATTIYSEEARDPTRTVPRATYFSVVLIGGFYIFTSWLMANGAGIDKLVPTLAGLADPTTFLFDLANRYVGGPITTIMGILFVTSLFAGVLAFHNGAARYKYVAGREGILPASVGVTHAQHQSPHVGSVIQTAISFTVITLFAVLAFFARNTLGESLLATRILPLISGLVMLYLFVIIFRDFGAMTGTEGWLGVALPSLVLAAALKARDPAKFARLGRNRAQS